MYNGGVPLGPHRSRFFLSCSLLKPVDSFTPKNPNTSSTVLVWALSIPVGEKSVLTAHVLGLSLLIT